MTVPTRRCRPGNPPQVWVGGVRGFLRGTTGAGTRPESEVILMNELEIRQEQNGTALTLYLTGRLDTITAPQLEQYLQGILDGVQELVLDFANLAYLSSAGLRVLLKIRKQMDHRGNLVVRHPNDMIQEVFEVTGFADILTVEK